MKHAWRDHFLQGFERALGACLFCLLWSLSTFVVAQQIQGPRYPANPQTVAECRAASEQFTSQSRQISAQHEACLATPQCKNRPPAHRGSCSCIYCQALHDLRDQVSSGPLAQQNRALEQQCTQRVHQIAEAQRRQQEAEREAQRRQQEAVREAQRRQQEALQQAQARLEQIAREAEANRLRQIADAERAERERIAAIQRAQQEQQALEQRARLEQAQREQGQREQAQREQAQREQAQREAVERLRQQTERQKIEADRLRAEAEKGRTEKLTSSLLAHYERFNNWRETIGNTTLAPGAGLATATTEFVKNFLSETAVKDFFSAARRGTGQVIANPVLNMAEPFLDPENARNIHDAVAAQRRQATQGTPNENAAKQLREVMKQMEDDFRPPTLQSVP